MSGIVLRHWWTDCYHLHSSRCIRSYWLFRRYLQNCCLHSKNVCLQSKQKGGPFKMSFMILARSRIINWWFLPAGYIHARCILNRCEKFYILLAWWHWQGTENKYLHNEQEFFYTLPAKTIAGLFPPNSRVTLLTLSAAALWIILPTSVEPVDETCQNQRHMGAFKNYTDHSLPYILTPYLPPIDVFNIIQGD